MPRIFDNKYNYITNLFANEDELLKQIRTSLEKENKAINIGADEGKLLQLFLKIINAKNVLEVGTLYGYSTIWLARALPKGGKITTFEKEEKNAKIAKENFKKANLQNKIEVVIGDAKENLKKINGKFDAIFIDAEKSGYPIYFKESKRLIRKGGLIMADNVFQKGKVWEEDITEDKNLKTIKEFNLKVANGKYFSTIINTYDGLLIAIK
jgi:predicted O-methyltransferase YrrM